jgi:hypothetical protein
MNFDDYGKDALKELKKGMSDEKFKIFLCYFQFITLIRQ